MKTQINATTKEEDVLAPIFQYCINASLQLDKQGLNNSGARRAIGRIGSFCNGLIAAAEESPETLQNDNIMRTYEIETTHRAEVIV